MESAKELLCDWGFESRQPSKILRRPMELSEDEDPVLQDKTTPKPRKRVRCPYEFPTITSEGKPCAQPCGSIQNFEGHQRNHREGTSIEYYLADLDAKDRPQPFLLILGGTRWKPSQVLSLSSVTPSSVHVLSSRKL
ncbi:uncharacterized protein LOC121420334 [Lytechinus variegatus]|uniref:uncharacterized protein LOC121420334 n=1 Tax=Lytechinus variegatus TaxID=7654 RepID=UPI001BB2A930|nr:uncharacterized protein LOC121420334 [Lytechinus variegatus]